MRETNSAADFERVSLPQPKSRAGEITDAIKGKTSGLAKAGSEKRRGQMSKMMFDMVDLGSQRSLIMRLQRLLDCCSVANRFKLLPQQFRMLPAREAKFHPLAKRNTRPPIDCDMIDAAQSEPRLAQAVVDRAGRQARPMFDSPKTFLFRRGNNFSIHDQARSGIGIIRIKPENRHRVRSDLSIRVKRQQV